MSDSEFNFDRELWQSRIRTIIVVLAIVLALAIIIWAVLPGIAPNWTGFVADDSVDGGNKVNRTLWDWLELMLIPAALLLGAWWVSHPKRLRSIEQDSHISGLPKDIEIIEGQHQEKRIQIYFDTMTELLLKHGLRGSSDDDEVRHVARAQTMTVLWALNSERKGSLVRFLYESQLIQHPDPVISLAGANLSAANLSGTNLSDADLRQAHLSDANFANAQLHSTDLAEADLSGAVMPGSVQKNMPAGIPRWVPPILRRANLNGSNLSEAQLADTDLTEASLQYALLDKADLKDSILRGADLKNVRLREADLDRANLRGADLSDADLSGAKMNSALLSKAILTRANMTDLEARQVNMKEADLSASNLSDARLPKAFLFSCNLREADLRGANLRGANLSHANLTGARLDGADLRGAYLSSAVISEEQLESALSIDGVIMPDNRPVRINLAPNGNSSGEQQSQAQVVDNIRDNSPTSSPS